MLSGIVCHCVSTWRTSWDLWEIKVAKKLFVQITYRLYLTVKSSPVLVVLTYINKTNTALQYYSAVKPGNLKVKTQAQNMLVRATVSKRPLLVWGHCKWGQQLVRDHY